MFTIRHISPNNHEALHEASAVSFSTDAQAAIDRTSSAAATATYDPGTVWVTPPNQMNPSYPITGGSVYVMNDAGATVAKYDLGGWPPPS